MRDRYATQRKTERDARLLKFIADNPGKTDEQVGRRFRLSRQRVHQIRKKNEETKGAAS